MVLYTSTRNVAIYAAFAIVMAKTYSNSFLVVLNSRAHILGGRESLEEGTRQHISIHPRPHPNSDQGTIPVSETELDVVRVDILEEVCIHRDPDAITVNTEVTSILHLFALAGLTDDTQSVDREKKRINLTFEI